MIQRAFRNLVLWTIWFSASLMIYAGLYQDTSIWSFIESDTSRITWVIMGLFMIGLLLSFTVMILTTLDTKQIDDIENNNPSSGLSSFFEIKNKRVLLHFFQSLKTILLHNGHIDLDALVEIEISGYQRAARTVEIIGNLLITLGLIGTVVGLTLTLTGLTNSLDALGHDQEQLLKGLRTAMSGMGTAFYTTLLGSVLGGILLRVFGHINEHGVEILQESLTRLCLVHGSSDLKPAIHRDMRLINNEMQLLDTNFQSLQQKIDQSRESLGFFIKGLEGITSYKPNKEEQDNLHQQLKMHREYLHQLQYELKLYQKQSIWGRVKQLFS